jgi:hypothetical protein
MARKDNLREVGDELNNHSGNGELPSLPSTAPDPFDIGSLRLSGDLSASLGVQKALLSVPVRKPDKTWFVRVHPSSDYAIDTYVIELKEERENYLVAKPLWPELVGEANFSPRSLLTAINRQGVLFLWPVRLPGPDGKIDEWSRTAMEGAKMSRERWVRVTSNMAAGSYDVFYATGDLPDPEWPPTPFKDLLRTAFKDRLIEDMNHPVLRKLRGEI